jgi:hypothetical protein
MVSGRLPISSSLISSFLCFKINALIFLVDILKAKSSKEMKIKTNVNLCTNKLINKKRVNYVK